MLAPLIIDARHLSFPPKEEQVAVFSFGSRRSELAPSASSRASTRFFSASTATSSSETLLRTTLVSEIGTPGHVAHNSIPVVLSAVGPTEAIEPTTALHHGPCANKQVELLLRPPRLLKRSPFPCSSRYTQPPASFTSAKQLFFPTSKASYR
jgi:hypothetical protein